MEDNSYNLIRDILRSIQADISGIKKIRPEIRDGFASMRQHILATQTDHNLLERRQLQLETELDGIKARIGLADSVE